jgi:transposase-like protein
LLVRLTGHDPAPDTLGTASLLAAPRHQPLAGDKPAKKRFKTYPIGYFHIDIAEVRTGEGKIYLYVAIDRTSKFAFVQLARKTGRTSASAFLVALIAAVPYKIHTALTDNGGPSGYANPNTDKAIRDFQKDNGLQVDGVLIRVPKDRR